MRCLLIVLLTSIFTDCFCQLISGRIIDETTGESLDYVNVRIANSNIGTVSMRGGEFKLNIIDSKKDDTVRFSYIGYETLSIAVGHFGPLTQEIIKLKPKSLILNEVVVAVKSETHILGNPKVDRRYTGWGDVQSLRGRIRGLLIEGAACPVKVKSISFRINHNDWDSVAFRVNFLEVKDNKPSNTILNKNIYVTTDKKHKWVRVDLNDKDIIICTNIVVTLEWIDAWGSIGEYSNLLTISMGKNSGFLYSQEPGEEVGTFTIEKNSPAIILEVYGDQ
jgi:hypothetical protein